MCVYEWSVPKVTEKIQVMSFFNVLSSLFVDGAPGWLKRVNTLRMNSNVLFSSCEFCWYCTHSCLLQMDEPVSVLPEPDGYKVDLEHLLGIVGIVGTVLNLLVVVFVYVYTPVWRVNAQPGLGRTYSEAVDWKSSHLTMEGLQPQRRAAGVCSCNYSRM